MFSNIILKILWRCFCYTLVDNTFEITLFLARNMLSVLTWQTSNKYLGQLQIGSGFSWNSSAGYAVGYEVSLPLGIKSNFHCRLDNWWAFNLPVDMKFTSTVHLWAMKYHCPSIWRLTCTVGLWSLKSIIGGRLDFLRLLLVY